MAENIGRHVKTIRKHLQNPKYRNVRSDIRKSRSVGARDISHLKRCELKTPRSTTQSLFADTGIKNVSKTTRNKIIGTFAKHKKKLHTGLR